MNEMYLDDRLLSHKVTFYSALKVCLNDLSFNLSNLNRYFIYNLSFCATECNISHFNISCLPYAYCSLDSLFIIDGINNQETKWIVKTTFDISLGCGDDP